MLDIIIVIGCILVGYALGKFAERKICEKGRFYQDLATYINLLKDNVTGRQIELASFNEEFAKNCGGKFSDYLLQGTLKVRLTKAQKEYLTKFFENLDCVSSQALIEHLNYYGKILIDNSQKVIQYEVSKSSIYGKLGMLLGAMLGILLV